MRAQIRSAFLVDSAVTRRAQIRSAFLTGTTRSPRAQVRSAFLTGSAGIARVQIRSAFLTGGALGALSANAGGGRQVDASSLVVLDGTASTGNPTGYAWAQVSNGAPTVSIVGSGPVVGFVAPATVAGCDVVIQLTVTLGPTTDTDQATVSVYPQLRWYLDAGGTWRPTQPSLID